MAFATDLVKLPFFVAIVVVGVIATFGFAFYQGKNK